MRRIYYRDVRAWAPQKGLEGLEGLEVLEGLEGLEGQHASLSPSHVFYDVAPVSHLPGHRFGAGRPARG